MRSELVFLSSCIVLTSCAGLRPEAEQVEVTVCSPIKERIVFWLWNKSAGTVDPTSIGGISNVQEIAYRTEDDRDLKGYKLSSTVEDKALPIICSTI